MARALAIVLMLFGLAAPARAGRLQALAARLKARVQARLHPPPADIHTDPEGWLREGGFRPGKLGGGLVLDADGVLRAPSGDYDFRTKEWASQMLSYAQRMKAGPFAEHPAVPWRPRTLTYDEAKTKYRGQWVVPIGLSAPLRVRLTPAQKAQVAERTAGILTQGTAAQLDALSGHIDHLERMVADATAFSGLKAQDALAELAGAEVRRQVAHGVADALAERRGELDAAHARSLGRMLERLGAFEVLYERHGGERGEHQMY